MQFRLSICLVILLCIFFVNIYCDEDDTFDDVTQSVSELGKINSFFFKSESNLDNSVTQESTNNQYFKTAPSCNYKESDERNTQEAVFYKRMVAVLLSNLVMQRVGDRLIGTLNMEVSPSEYKYLQNFVKGQGSMKEVDKMLDSVIKPSNYTASYFVAEISYYSNILLELLIRYASIMKEHWDITIISLIVIFSFIVLRNQQWSRGLVIFLLLDIIILISFFLTWWQLVQEAEIKLMAAQAQFSEMPIACKPHKMGIWDKIVTWFSRTNECEKYYETLMTNPKLQVTPAFALTHFVTKVVLHPLSYAGVVMSEFIDNATSKMNFVYASFTTVILCITFCICLILLPFILMGGAFDFGIGFFKFGIKGRERRAKRECIDRIYENISSEKHLKGPEKMKQITFEQDPAGGDAGVNAHHPDEKLDEKREEVTARAPIPTPRISPRQSLTDGDKKKEGKGDC